MQFLVSNLLMIGFSLLLMNSIKCDEREVFYNLPGDFKFGAASASYQIEGAWNVDGKTPSIWDTFTHDHPELIKDHSNADVGADSYHLFQKDIDALKEIGVRTEEQH